MTSLSKFMEAMKDLFDFRTNDLFGSRGLARSSDPDTSHVAAAKISAARLEEMVYEKIRSFGSAGCAADDVVQLMPDIKSNSITPRFAPLIKKGLVVDSGRRKRISSGSTQRVLVASSFVREGQCSQTN